MSKETPLTIELQHLDGYAFKVKFADAAGSELLVDESPPLGEGKGPSPSQLLLTAVANCLSASLLYCLYKARHEPKDMRTRASAEFVRNESGRLRIGHI